MTDRKAADYGKGEHSIEDVDADVLLMSPVELLAIFRSPKYQAPVLPQIAIELMDLVRKPDVNYQVILRVLERDPMIAAKILRVAQSAMFTTRTPVQSLKDALVRLGLVTLTNILLEVTMQMTLFRVKEYEEPMNQLRRHSTATGYLARAVAHATGQPIDYAFLCGLLHDSGMAGALIALAKPATPGAKPPPFEHVWPAIRDSHEEATEVLAKAWKLAPDIVTILGHHHHFIVDKEPNKMAAAVCLADSVANDLGLGMNMHIEPSLVTQAMSALKISDATMQELAEYGQKVVGNID